LRAAAGARSVIALHAIGALRAAQKNRNFGFVCAESRKRVHAPPRIGS
jgi:hypothetical protein